MDFDSLKNQVASISLYDIKAGFRKAQNGKYHLRRQVYINELTSIAVMNYTEMEAKVSLSTSAPQIEAYSSLY